MVAIDLGSNTIRFIEFDGLVWGKSFEKIVRTAEGLHETKNIGEKVLDRIIDAIKEAKTKLDFSHQRVVGYTTAAMRLAHNKEEALEKIESETGIAFAVIDADKEAALTLNAVRYRLSQLGMTPSSFLLVDIGGGSTELIQYADSRSTSLSLDIGIVTLTESTGSASELDMRLNIFRSKVREVLEIHFYTQLILTAGTPTTIAAYLCGMDYTTYDPEKINGYRLLLADCYRVYNELLAMDELTRARYVGIGRENLIIAGVRMVTAIYEAIGCEEAIIIDDGLREGIALEYYKLH